MKQVYQNMLKMAIIGHPSGFYGADHEPQCPQFESGQIPFVSCHSLSLNPLIFVIPVLLTIS